MRKLLLWGVIVICAIAIMMVMPATTTNAPEEPGQAVLVASVSEGTAVETSHEDALYTAAMVETHTGAQETEACFSARTLVDNTGTFILADSKIDANTKTRPLVAKKNDTGHEILLV